MNIDEIIDKLKSEYGNRVWRQHNEPVSELILTVLSQHTSDVNSRRAFDKLVSDFKTWGEVANADPGDIAQSVWTAGLARVKGARIKAILQMILQRCGSLNLDFLAQLPMDEAKLWLEQLPGVGPKTAGCVLLFSFGLPVLPIDTHIHRVAKRLRLIDEKTSANKAHQILEPMVPHQEIYSFHINMIEHGRRVCNAQNRKCQKCVFTSACPSSRIGSGKTTTTSYKIDNNNKQATAKQAYGVKKWLKQELST
jgi:endonuclease-3